MVILFIYMLGSNVPIPFARMTHMYVTMLNKTPVGMMSILSGANLSRLSLFSIGLSPFMTSMMVIQLMTMAHLFWIDTLSMNQVMMLQQWVTLVLAIVSAAAMTFMFHLTGNFYQALAVILVWTAGSMFVLWLGVMNMRFGIGGTMTLVLFNMILGSLQPLQRSLRLLTTLDHSAFILAALIIFGLVDCIFWVAFNRTYYRADLIDVSLRSSVKPLTMPFGLNLGGMMTYMIGMAILTIPIILLQASGGKLRFLTFRFQLWFCLLTSFFLFYFFAFMQMNPRDQAKGLRDKNNYVLGVRPGKPTARFIRNHLLFTCFPGALLNSLQLTLGIIGSQFLGKYTAFALIPMDIVMVVMFMNVIKDQFLVLTVPKRYQSLMKKEGM